MPVQTGTWRLGSVFRVLLLITVHFPNTWACLFQWYYLIWPSLQTAQFRTSVTRFQDSKAGADRKEEDKTKFSAKQCLPFCMKEIIGEIMLDWDMKASFFFFLNGGCALCKRNRMNFFFKKRPSITSHFLNKRARLLEYTVLQKHNSWWL